MIMHNSLKKTLILICIIGQSTMQYENGNGKEEEQHHGGHQGNNIPFPTFIHCSSKGKCGLLPQHYGHRMRRRCNHLILLSLIFRPAALCWWAQNNNNNNNVSLLGAPLFTGTVLDNAWLARCEDLTRAADRL